VENVFFLAYLISLYYFVDVCYKIDMLVLLFRALEIQKRALGEFHIDVPISLINLGVVEQIRGNLDKSLEYYDDGINIYKASITLDRFLK